MKELMKAIIDRELRELAEAYGDPKALEVVERLSNVPLDLDIQVAEGDTAQAWYTYHKEAVDRILQGFRVLSAALLDEINDPLLEQLREQRYADLERALCLEVNLKEQFRLAGERFISNVLIPQIRRAVPEFDRDTDLLVEYNNRFLDYTESVEFVDLRSLEALQNTCLHLVTATRNAILDSVILWSSFWIREYKDPIFATLPIHVMKLLYSL